MTRKLLLCLIYFSLSPLVLCFSVFFLNFFGEGKVLGETISLSPRAENTGIVLSSSSENTSVISPMIIAKDSTSIMIENYLRRYKSPLLPYKDKILECCARYGISSQLLVAIAQQESNLGKTSPESCFNAWGWGIHANGTTCFNDWGEAIETVAKGIAKNYCQKGYCDDPCVMMKKYTPKSNGSWCAGVKQFLAELETGDF